MKGHMQDGKFHPHTEYKKGIRKSRDQNAKQDGVKIRKRHSLKEEDPEPETESEELRTGYDAELERALDDELTEKLDQRDYRDIIKRMNRKQRVQPDLGHGAGLFAEFKSKQDFWDYLQEGRQVQRIFEDNSPNMVPKERNTVNKVSWKTQSKVGFGTIGQSPDPISYLYKSELKNAVLEPDTVFGGTNVIIHDKDEFTDLRRVYRVWND